MLLHSITVRLAKMIDASPTLLAISVLLIAVTLFAILFGIIWYCKVSSVYSTECKAWPTRLVSSLINSWSL